MWLSTSLIPRYIRRYTTLYQEKQKTSFSMSWNEFVATYPSAGGRRGAHVCIFQGRNDARSRHQCLFEENVGKTRTCGLRALSVKGSGVVFTHEEGISTTRVRHKGWQPSIKCANMTSKLRIFPFLCFYVFSLFLCFLAWVFCIFYLFMVNKGVSLCSYVSSIVMRKLDLRSSSRTKRWLSCFYLFSQDWI